MSRLRYLLMLRSMSTAHHREKASALGLSPKELGGMVLFLSGSGQAAAQYGVHALVLGSVYPRSAYGPPHSQARLGAVDFDPARLLDRFWGDYLFVDATDGRSAIYRSPSGRMPAYYVATAQGAAIASDCDLLIEMGFASGRIDWGACLLQLAQFEPLFRSTALEGVSELLPGAALDLTGSDAVQRAWWHPWHHVGDAPPRGSSDCADSLRKVIVDCARAQVAGASDILVRVSGGLDSSIVAASMAPADERVALMILIAGDGDGDERHHARLLAAHLRRPLREVRYGPDDVDLEQASFPDLPGPRGRHLSQAIRRICERQLDGAGEAVVLTGYGGDGLFGALNSVRPIVDRWIDGGPAGAVRAGWDVARQTESSLSEVVGKTLRFLARGRRDYHPGANDMFLASERFDALAPSPIHPDMRAPERMRPGKAMHIAMILGALRHIEQSEVAGGTPELPVLMAQPVIETCLAIPSWRWCAEGRDRAMARQAFDGMLPKAIARRSSKGGPDAFCTRLVEGRRDMLRSRLLDGILAREGLLDRDAVEQALRPDQALASDATIRLLQLSDAESWCRARIDRARRGTPASPLAIVPSV